MEEPKMSNVNTMKDMVSLDIRLPVVARMKKRVKEIQKLCQAVFVKIPFGNTHVFESTPPKMFISNLRADMDGNVGVISYQKYKKDKDGINKLARITTKDVTMGDGTTKKIEVDAAYIIDKLVIERIHLMKPIQREELNYETQNK